MNDTNSVSLGSVSLSVVIWDVALCIPALSKFHPQWTKHTSTLFSYSSIVEPFESRKGDERERETERRRRRKCVEGVARNTILIRGGRHIPLLLWKCPGCAPSSFWWRVVGWKLDCSVIRQQRKEYELSLLNYIGILTFDVVRNLNPDVRLNSIQHRCSHRKRNGGKWKRKFCRLIIAVYSENHAKPRNELCVKSKFLNVKSRLDIQ
jgi:hypothetical protein